MLRITKVAPDRIDITLSGDIDAIEMQTGLDHLIAAAADMKNGKMLYRISDFEFPSLGALAVELGYLPSLFGLLPKIGRCAVLCDASWLRQAAEFEGLILPGIDIRGFAHDEEPAAIAWLNAVDADEFEDVPV